ncbi:NADH dehydrogenase [ubiquinone] 1 alpha subcomplex subunit 1 [Cynoglossus semilaevis]|uniref:NADH dehydrogenase [ubiquinone] 1 alpha subcomplex subunit 1 n=1 Tax=Cynoglossus semilaevis TaxID=244447 RepID=A0A3P8UQZ9_CYNSE|nr:NADH dehydrogenase [ubiquinone] 1 alpha subcomplex subunit 1 [Cynoglossus semilaevis]
MWYEILPCLGLVYGCLTLPGHATRLIHWFTYDGKEKRNLRRKWLWYLMDRDTRVSKTGIYYEAKGLENIH